MPRMSTRRWMVAVALVGLLMGAGIGGARLKERREYFLSAPSTTLTKRRGGAPIGNG